MKGWMEGSEKTIIEGRMNELGTCKGGRMEEMKGPCLAWMFQMLHRGVNTLANKRVGGERKKESK
jgi:hypothetical protein